MGTYTAKHYPVAVEQDHFTYFVFSGPAPLTNNKTIIASTDGATNPEGSPTANPKFARADGATNALGIFVARFNHQSNKVSAPLLVHAKFTDDPHDNAVINKDDDGNLYILVAGRANKRGAFLYRLSKNNVTSTKTFSVLTIGLWMMFQQKI
jgi:hypothetical protein